MAGNDASASAVPRTRRILYLSAVQFDAELRAGTRSVLDLAPLAAALGLQGVEYREGHWRDKARELMEIKGQLLRHKLRAVYAVTTSLYSEDPAASARLLQDIEDAREMGAFMLRAMLGIRPVNAPANAPIRYAARLAVERAGGRRIALSMENNSRAPGEKMESLRAALEEFDCRYVGTTLDFANYAATGQNPVEAIRALSRWVNYVHVKDATKTPDGWVSTYPGNGSLPMAEILAALDGIGRRLPFCLEYPGEGDSEGTIRKSLAFLSGC
jgi:sugar phosphate isomerase/epimerase